MSPVGDPALKLCISSTPLTKERGFPLIVLETEGPREEQPHQGIKFDEAVTQTTTMPHPMLTKPSDRQPGIIFCSSSNK